MKHPESKEVNHYTNNNAEIPSLVLSIVRSTADFEKENITLRSTGWSMEEAMEGMEYLIEQSKQMKNADDKDK